VHQKTPFCIFYVKISKIFWGGSNGPLLNLSPSGRGTPAPTPLGGGGHSRTPHPRWEVWLRAWTRSDADRRAWIAATQTKLKLFQAKKDEYWLTRVRDDGRSTKLWQSSQKMAIVTPLMKKSCLDTADMASYRPVSNLSFISKTVERIMAQQLNQYMLKNAMMPSLQSAYRHHHSTETALL